MRGALLEKARHRAESQVFVPGRFKEFGTGDQVIYVEAMDYESGEMSNVFVRVRTPNRQYVRTSHAAHQVVRPASGARYMVLENGYRYAGLPWDAKLSVTPGLPSVPEGPLKRINFSSPHLLGLWRLSSARPSLSPDWLSAAAVPASLPGLPAVPPSSGLSRSPSGVVRNCSSAFGALHALRFVRVERTQSAPSWC